MANASKSIKDLDLGESTEFGTLLPGITDARLSWELIESQPTEGKRTYVVSMFGIIVRDITLKEVAK